MRSPLVKEKQLPQESIKRKLFSETKGHIRNQEKTPSPFKEANKMIVSRSGVEMQNKSNDGRTSMHEVIKINDAMNNFSKRDLNFQSKNKFS